MSYQSLISIHGAPRSGTSWLGQIFNRHSRVAYRFQPFFSYRFRGRLSPSSSVEDVRRVLHELYEVADDDFIAGKWPPPKPEDAASAPALDKQPHPDVMVIKEVRYHYLIENIIRAVPGVKIIGIVRNPCAVINSWLHNPREFSADWDALAEWRSAPNKNRGEAGEYFGFEKWKELTSAFLRFERKYRGIFFILKYEHLVDRPLETIAQLFSFTGLDMEAQVTSFIQESQHRHDEDPYAVYKSPDVKDRWRTELDARIAHEITEDLKRSELARFLE